MSRKSNTILIGLFVIVSLIFFCAAVFVFSSSRLFSKKMTFYVFFDTSLNGLDIGAPVKFKGVKVGNVESIEAIYQNEMNEVITVVLFNINTNLFRSSKGKKINLRNHEDFYSEQIARGLAAKLSIESILTGKLYVGLDYFVNKQAKFAGDIDLKKLRQMPSVPTELEEFMATFDVIMKKLAKIELDEISQKITDLIDSFREKVKGLDLSSLNKAMNAISEILSVESTTRQALDSSLQQLPKTLRSLRILLEFLERNPNALVAGKAQ